MNFKPNNINPQGRSKVYFCCHPNDFDKYFEVVSNEILEKQKCTIWYVENEDERNDEYLSNLKEMQLFVMPVTTNLLCTDNIALDVEFKFAMKIVSRYFRLCKNLVLKIYLIKSVEIYSS